MVFSFASLQFFTWFIYWFTILKIFFFTCNHCFSSTYIYNTAYIVSGSSLFTWPKPLCLSSFISSIIEATPKMIPLILSSLVIQFLLPCTFIYLNILISITLIRCSIFQSSTWYSVDNIVCYQSYIVSLASNTKIVLHKTLKTSLYSNHPHIILCFIYSS